MSKQKTLSYAEALQELEENVAKLQSPQCDIDQLCTLTARSIELLKMCKAKLVKVDDELVKLLDNIEQ
ncbi:MAG: exodeoxyribonuclease VII small subunit [Bacteroidales bacterium]|nr:exodeoxyribonuclease VII small subunit [Bacteroidales bacterium]